jgi:hypothetical protein
MSQISEDSNKKNDANDLSGSNLEQYSYEDLSGNLKNIKASVRPSVNLIAENTF